MEKKFLLISLNKEMKDSCRVDFIVYEGIKKGQSSKIIDLTDDVRVIER